MEWKPRLNGSALERAVALVDDRAPSGSWMIGVEMTEEGKNAFAELTAENVGKPLGIFIDGEEISTPIVQMPITEGHVQITGMFTQEEATQMAGSINSGALPVKLEILESAGE
jgi:preprotein translocase subunit SecD